MLIVTRLLSVALPALSTARANTMTELRPSAGTSSCQS